MVTLSLEEKKPLEHLSAVKLSHTRLNPGEWIGTLSNGNRIHIVANGKTLRISTAEDLNTALRNAMDGDVERVKVNIFHDRSISTQEMLEATGLGLDCEVAERTIDSYGN